MEQFKRLMKSKWTINIILFVFSSIVGILLYIGFLMDLLPRFFANMENIEKNIIAIIIIIISLFILLKIVFNLDKKFDQYLLFLLYVTVLILGLLRPDQQNFGENGVGLYAWNPLGFTYDIKGDNASMIVMAINLVIFLPMYFLLVYTKIFKTFIMRLLAFEVFAFSIEFLQAKFKVGTFDLSDIFLYNISFFVGCLISLPILKVLKKRSLKYKNHVEGERKE